MLPTAYLSGPSAARFERIGQHLAARQVSLPAAPADDDLRTQLRDATAHYVGSLQNLLHFRNSQSPLGLLESSQNTLRRALTTLNGIRRALGYDAMVGPPLLSLDELLDAGQHAAAWEKQMDSLRHLSR